MEVYHAIDYFLPPQSCSGFNVLEFNKGDQFEVLEKKETREENKWWGVRLINKTFSTSSNTSLQDDIIGFVPSSYLKFDYLVKPQKLTDKEKLRQKACTDLLSKMQKMEQTPDPEVEAEPKAKSGDISPFLQRAPIDSRLLEDHSNEDDLIKPKKLPNPCLDSRERKDLHRELKFNNKRGVDVLNQKSELQKEIERRQDAGKKKTQPPPPDLSKRNSLQIQLDKQAEKLQQHEKEQKEKEAEAAKPEAEFLRVHAQIKKH